MKDIQSILFYTLGILGLVVVTFLGSNQIEAEINDIVLTTPAPILTTTPTPLPPTRVAVAAGPLGCITTPLGGRGGYRPQSEFTNNLVPADSSGQILRVSGTVFASDCKTPLSGVVLEVWQADQNGNYSDAGLRGRLVSDAQGHYEFTTLKPVPMVQANKYIPARVHFLVKYPTINPLNIQLYFEGDPFLQQLYGSIAVERLTRPLQSVSDENGPRLQTTFNIVLSAEPPQLRPDSHTWRGLNVVPPEG